MAFNFTVMLIIIVLHHFQCQFRYFVHMDITNNIEISQLNHLVTYFEFSHYFFFC